MSIRKHPTKDGWWILDITHGRKSRDRIPFCGSWAEAFAEHARLEQLKTPVKSYTKTIGDTVADFIREYRQEKSPQTVTDFLYAWKRLQPLFGKLHYHQLTPDHIIDYREKRLADTWTPCPHAKDPAAIKQHTRPISKRTITKELSYLSSLVKWAVKKGYCTTLSWRIEGFPKKQVKPKAPIVLDGGEFEAILDQMREPQRTMIILMHDAGLRKSECYPLTREQVDLRNNIITVIGKGNKERKIPIIGERLTTAITTACEKTKTGPLFVSPFTEKPFVDIRASFQRAASRAGVSKRVYNHLFRHCFGTDMARSGVHPTAMKDILGHETFATTDMYVHNAGEFIKTEIEKMQQNRATRARRKT